MKLAYHHRQRGDEIYFTKHVERGLWEPDYQRVYGSAIFSHSAERVAAFKQHFPEAIVGGTYNVLDNTTVEAALGIDESEVYDYSIYPKFDGSRSGACGRVMSSSGAAVQRRWFASIS